MKFITTLLISLLTLDATAAPAPVMLCIQPEQLEGSVNARLREGWKVQHQSFVYNHNIPSGLYILVTLIPPTAEEAKRIQDDKLAERELKRAEFLRKQEEMQRNVEAPSTKPKESK